MIVLTGTVVAAATTGFLRLQAEIRAQLPGILQARLEAALQRKVQIGTVSLNPLGVSVEGLRVFRSGADREDPLVAKHLNVGLDWWSLLRDRRWRVSQVEASDARIRVTQGTPSAQDRPWTQQVLALSGTGIERFRVRNASLGLLPAAGPALWTANGVTGDLVPRADEFHYDAQAKQFGTPDVQLASLQLAGTGDAQGITLKKGTACYQGARVKAHGQLKAARNEALVTLQVDRLPLARLASRLGIPAEWAMQGSVTGAMTVDARDNALRAVKGNVEIARGSLANHGGELPWNSAHAAVDWTPTRTRLSQVRVQGNSVILTAEGEVVQQAGQPFTGGQFNITGELGASDPRSVTQVADLLAFRQLLEGRWKASSAVVRFQSHGVVDQLAKAEATGHIHVDGLTFRPTVASAPVTVQRLDADLERNGPRLAFNQVKAVTGGSTISGEAQLSMEEPGQPAEFLASGKVDVADLNSLREAVPEASLWKWVPQESASARGSVQFRLGGPLGAPDRLWSEGHFEAREFQLAAHTPLSNGAPFSLPVHTASGDFRHAHGRLEVKNLALAADALQGEGDLSVDFRGKAPVLAAAVRVQAADWRQLPTLSPTVLPELSGGAVDARLQIRGGLNHLAQSEVTGQFRVHDVAYTPARRGAEPLPVRELAADFRWAGGEAVPQRTLELSAVRLDSPLVQATATGSAVPHDGDYTLALDVDAKAPDVAQLAERLAVPVRLAGGSGAAQFHLGTSLKQPVAAKLEGSLALQDTRLLRPVQLLDLDEVAIRSLRAKFSGGLDQLQVSELTLDAPGVQANASGELTGRSVTAKVHLQSERWNAPKGFPVAGGAVELDGTLAGDVAAPETMTFRGGLNLRHAHAAFRTEKLALSGGTIDASVQGEGTLAEPLNWVRGGEISAQGTEWSSGARSLKLDRAKARFTQEAGQIRVAEATLSTGDAQLHGIGTWSQKGHEAEITATGRDLAIFGVTLPESLRTGDYQLSATLRGTFARPVQSLAGRLQVQDVRLAAGKLPAQTLATVATRFNFDGERLELMELNGSGPAVSLTGHGAWTRSGHQLTLALSGADFTRLGVALPEGFGLGAFQVQAALSGRGRQWVTAGTGTLRLDDARFKFGPAATHHLEHVATAFRLDGKRVTLSEVRADGPAGDFTGSGEISEGRFRLALTSPSTNPDLVQWLVPGHLQGGSLAGTLTLEGNSAGQVQAAGGHLEFKDGTYSAPETMGLLGGSFPVNRIGADYRWQRYGEKGRTALTGIQLETALGSGTGTLNAVDGTGTLLADLTSGNTGLVADRWPALYAHLLGGVGTGKLQMQFDSTGARGTLAVKAQGGTLMLPGEVPEYAQQPVTTMSGVLGFEPGKLTFNDVQVRGPKANLDGSGTWIDGGEVTGSGKAWFSKSYTAKLIKPSGFGWLAKLFGLKEIKSDFTVSGTSDRVKLNAGITRGLLWKVAKGQVPKEFQKIATGKSPLWVKPLVVAEAQTPGIDPNLAPAPPQDGGD